MRIFRSSLIGFTAALLCVFASAPGPAAAQAPRFPADSLGAKIQQRGRLIAGVKTDLPFISYLNPETSRLEGFEPEVAREIAKALFGDPAKVEFKQVVSRTRIPMVREGVVDVVLGTLSITEERRKEIDFSDAYFLTGMRVLAPRGSTVKGTADLKAGTKIGIIKGSMAVKYLKQLAPQATVLEFETSSDYFLALQNKRLDAAVGDETTLIGLMSRDNSMHLAGAPLSTEAYGVGFKKGSPEFVSFVNKVVGGMKTSGRWKQIYKDVFGRLGLEVPEPPK